MIHSIVRKLRTVLDRGARSRGTHGAGGGRTRRNPWPRCGSCYHRNPLEETCTACALCGACCETCDTCGRCVMRCPGHDTRQDGGTGEQDAGRFTFSAERA